MTQERDNFELRVMHVVLTLGVGGTERLVIELVKRLNQVASSAVCCLDNRGAWADELIGAGVAVHELRRQPGFQPSLALRLARLAMDTGADILHCHHYSPFVYGQLAALLRPRLRIVFTEHGRLSNAPPSRKRQIANAMLGRLNARIFAVSHSLRDHMAAEGLPAHRIGVIHNGIEPGLEPDSANRIAARERLGLDTSVEIVGTVARLDPVKDLPTLIEAMRQVRDTHRSAKLVIVGEGPERHRLEALVRTTGLSDTVILTGHRADVTQLLPGFDVYVNCSLSEGISISILEAMAAGLPVVATAVGGNPEIVTDGGNGRVVTPANPPVLGNAIVRLLDSPPARAALGRAGRARVLDEFTFDRMAQAYLRAYMQPRGA